MVRHSRDAGQAQRVVRFGKQDHAQDGGAHAARELERREAAYAAQQAGGAHAEGDHGHDDHGAGHTGGHGKDDVIDADFREVGDDDKKKRA